MTNDRISVYLNRGASSFSPAIRLGAGRGYRALALVDLDGDHLLDICAVHNLDSAFSVFRNPGHDMLGEEKIIPALGNSGLGAIAAGDLDGDGNPDLAVGRIYLGIHMNRCR